MMAYSGGDEFPCVVGEVGSYSTKMGFAGEAYPRSYFRSTTAILRDGETSSTSKSRKVIKRSYDFFTRSLKGGSDSNAVEDDGGWEASNPIESSTGLVYDGRRVTAKENVPSSLNCNNDDGDKIMTDVTAADDAAASTKISGQNQQLQQQQQDFYSSGDCYTHFLNHLSHGYESSLSTDPQTTPLLLVEKSYNPPPIRQKFMEILFEDLNVPATFLAKDAVCACYAVGKSTGTVVDIGYNGTVVTPVYEGYVENKGIVRSPVGSRLMEEHMLEYLDGLYKTKKARSKLVSKHDYVMPLYQLRAKGNEARREPFHTLARLDMARLCKEDGSGAGVASFGYTSQYDRKTNQEANSNNDDDNTNSASVGGDDNLSQNETYQQYAIAPKTPYKLPDGTIIDIPQTKRFDIAELLFGKGGKSASIREEAVKRTMEQLDHITLDTGSDMDTDVNALVHLEEMTKRKRVGGSDSGRDVDTKQSAYHHNNQKLMKSCAPYLQSGIGELSSASIPAMIYNSALKCDRDQHAQLLGNAILCGGGACLSTAASSSSSVDYKDGNAMPERIRLELESIIHALTPGWRVKVLSPGLAERAVCSWLGASILGSLGSFHDMWITKAEYEEHGTSIVNRKCP